MYTYKHCVWSQSGWRFFDGTQTGGRREEYAGAQTPSSLQPEFPQEISKRNMGFRGFSFKRKGPVCMTVLAQYLPFVRSTAVFDCEDLLQCRPIGLLLPRNFAQERYESLKYLHKGIPFSFHLLFLVIVVNLPSWRQPRVGVTNCWAKGELHVILLS
jgi:hypothetical protein